MTHAEELTPEQYSEQYNARMHENFLTLIGQKFGNERGAQSGAAGALKIHPSNMSAMVKGSLKVSQVHIDKLLGMSDFIVPGIPEQIVPVNTGWRALLDIDFDYFEMLERIAKYHTPNGRRVPPMQEPEYAKTMIEFLIKDYHKQHNLGKTKDDVLA